MWTFLQCPQSIHGSAKITLVTKQQLWSLTPNHHLWNKQKNNVSLGVSIQSASSSSCDNPSGHENISCGDGYLAFIGHCWVTVFYLGLFTLVPMWLFITHEASAGGEPASLTPSPRISLTCSRLSACRISSSFTWRKRDGSVTYQFIINIGRELYISSAEKRRKKFCQFFSFRICNHHSSTKANLYSCPLFLTCSDWDSWTKSLCTVWLVSTWERILITWLRSSRHCCCSAAWQPQRKQLN